MSEDNKLSCAGIQDELTLNELPAVPSTASEGASRSDGPDSAVMDHLIMMVAEDPLSPFRQLAGIWRREEEKHRVLYYAVDAETRKQSQSFYQATWTRYVDYGRRASELEAILEIAHLSQVEWTEVRIYGEPEQDLPPYDFTFRSDQNTWSALPGILEVARKGGWHDLQVTTRKCYSINRATEWAEYNGNAD